MYAAWLFFGDHFKDIFFPDLDSWTSQIVITQEESGWSADSIFQVRALEGRVFLEPTVPFVWKNDHSSIERTIKLEEHNILVSPEGELTVILKRMKITSNEFRNAGTNTGDPNVLKFEKCH